MHLLHIGVQKQILSLLLHGPLNARIRGKELKRASNNFNNNNSIILFNNLTNLAISSAEKVL